MKTLHIVLPGLLIVVALVSSAQDFSPGSIRLSTANQQTIFVTRDHITFAISSSLTTLPLEDEIIALENRECDALLKRDTSALRRLWLRDFSLDEPLAGLVNDKNPLPYFVSLHRVIDKFTPLENMVFTSGLEHIQRMDAHGKLLTEEQRPFFHAWTLRKGSWVLSTNNHEQP